jgi:hypothetical protein
MQTQAEDPERDDFGAEPNWDKAFQEEHEEPPGQQEVPLATAPVVPVTAATGDALDYVGEVCIEGKCPISRKIVQGEIPSKYLPQLAVQQAVLGVPCVYVEYARRGGLVQWNVVRPDWADLELLFQRMLPILTRFHELVLQFARTGMMPREDEFEVLAVKKTRKRKQQPKTVAAAYGGGDALAGASGSTEFYDEPLCCTCRQPSFGKMITCGDANCRIQWFHCACVGISVVPATWFCKDCHP